MIDLLIPFQYEFFTEGFWFQSWSAVLVDFWGCNIILRGLSYIGHGMSHAIFGGAVVGYIANLNFYFGPLHGDLYLLYLLMRLQSEIK